MVTSKGMGQMKTEGLCSPSSWHSLDKTSANDNADLTFLKALLKDKRVVLLGESSHGIGDYYRLKSRIIEYLHKECGFEVLAMESGIADIALTYKNVDTLTAKQLRNNTVFGNFQCAEIMPLFDYIKETAGSKKPLFYAGFDSQNFSASLTLMQEILRKKWGKTGDSLMGCLVKYYRIPSIMWDDDRKPLIAISDSIKGAANMIAAMFRDSAVSIQQQFSLTTTDMRYLQLALSNHRDAVSLDWTKDDPISHRDKVMAGNLFWLMDSVYPGKKIIIWAHNGHIGRTSSEGNPNKWMGQYISEKYKEKSYHIGLFAREGETFEWWTKSNKPFLNNKPDDIEELSAFEDRTFISLAEASKTCVWPGRKVFGFELENGGRIEFVPKKRFDAVITFKKATLPTYGQ
ncbi:MAG: erythromycin esterase family protein [Chitinophagaceae bacterium]